MLNAFRPSLWLRLSSWRNQQSHTRELWKTLTLPAMVCAATVFHRAACVFWHQHRRRDVIASTITSHCDFKDFSFFFLFFLFFSQWNKQRNNGSENKKIEKTSFVCFCRIFAIQLSTCWFREYPRGRGKRWHVKVEQINWRDLKTSICLLLHRVHHFTHPAAAHCGVEH